MRTFEIPACGAFLCAQRTDEHQEIFRDGAEAVFFDDPDELKTQVTRYLNRDDARARIAAAGFHAVTQGAHTYADRIVEMMALARREMGRRADGGGAVPTSGRLGSDLVTTSGRSAAATQ